MSISFTQSMQSLQADHGRFSLWGLGVAALLLCSWFFWFLTPSLTVYANGHLTQLTRSGDLVATLSAQEGLNLRAGQTAHVYPPGVTTPQQSLPATVLDVTTPAQGNQLQMRLYLRDDTEIESYFPGGVSGEVQVEVETISPAVLLLQTLGQWVETPAVSLSPQPQLQ